RLSPAQSSPLSRRVGESGSRRIGESMNRRTGSSPTRRLPDSTGRGHRALQRLQDLYYVCGCALADPRNERVKYFGVLSERFYTLIPRGPRKPGKPIPVPRLTDLHEVKRVLCDHHVRRGAVDADVVRQHRRLSHAQLAKRGVERPLLHVECALHFPSKGG